MKLKTHLTLFTGLMLLVGLPACTVSFSGNIHAPASSQPGPTAVIPTANGPVYPLVPPDPQQGQLIYTDKCAPCHGSTGLGNGPQASKLPNPVKAIGQAEVARQSIPAEWFSVITQGNQAEYMMPFGESLTTRQRWDVLAYVYTLSASNKVISSGKAVYDANCAGCHNQQVQNTAAQTGSQLSDLIDQERMAGLAEADLYKTITDGIHPNMPAYGSSLSEEQRWAVSSYVRALTFTEQTVAYPAPEQKVGGAVIQAASVTTASPASPAAASSTADPAQSATEVQPQDASTTETPQASTRGSVNGTVTPPSGSALPGGLTVTLAGFDNSQVVLTQQAAVQPDGSFIFNDIEMPTGRVFMTFVMYNNYEYDSDVATIADSRAISLPVILYATSTDTSPLVSESMHVLFDFSQTGIVQVIELFVISNPTDKMIVAAQPGQPVLEFALPEGITNLQLDEGQIGQRYIKTTLGIGDTAGVKPGARQTQVGFAFNLPYQDKLDLSVPVPIPTNMVTFMLPTNSVKLQSSQLKSAGQQSAQGMMLYLYTSSNVSAGQVISASLSGKPAAVAAATASSSNATLWIGAGLFALALGATGFFVVRSRRTLKGSIPPDLEPPEVNEDVDSLLDAIAALDDMHAAGELPDPAYQQRRAELKAKLTVLYKSTSAETNGGQNR
jgi:mono/diheme cytochrome c family protein